MGDDPEISQWLEKLVHKAEETVNIDVNESDTLEQARRLLNSWAEQTETFQIDKGTGKSRAKKQGKVVQYRKLDAPMMVVKKETNRPSVDPTLIMEARRAHLKEMKAKRLERATKQQRTDVKPVRVQQSKVDVPDVDSEIRQYKERIANKMREKEQEIEDRRRRSLKIRAIEESAAQTIAKETEERMKAQKDEFDDESLKMRLQLVFKKQIIRKERHFFSIWSNKCHFQSKAFQRAALFSNFRRQAGFFALWKSQLKRVQHKKEMEMLERQLRRDKQMEDAATNFNARRTVYKALGIWMARYKAQIERKVIEEQHKKRRDLLITRITTKPAETKESPTKKTESPKQTESPRRAKHLKIPKTKITKLKTDQRVEAMAKRMDEQKAKRLERVQKEAEAAQAAEEAKMKAEIEAQRKKRIEHRQFLEKEKKKRDEQKQRQQEYERQVARKKYCEKACAEFRLRRLKLNQFKQWAKVAAMRSHFEQNAEKQYRRHLLHVSMHALGEWTALQQNEREKIAVRFYTCRITHYVFLEWLQETNNTVELGSSVAEVSDYWRQKRAFTQMRDVQRKRRKEKHAAAVAQGKRNLLRRCFRAWPVGCSRIREEQERENTRADLMSRALQYLDELEDDY